MVCQEEEDGGQLEVRAEKGENGPTERYETLCESQEKVHGGN